jgi:hypothetical protein
MSETETTEKNGHPEESKLRSEHLHLREVLGRVLGHMKSRNADLGVSERTLLDRVARQQITLLNPVSRKLHMEFMTLMHSTMQLECKMARRGMFYLRSRERTLKAKIEDIELRAREAGIELNTEGSGVDAESSNDTQTDSLEETPLAAG